MSLEHIPLELRELDQWVVWRLEDHGHKKPTKVPYNARTGYRADITNPDDYSSFATCSSFQFLSNKPVDPGLPVGQTGYSGSGFVLSCDDPYSILDLDDCEGNLEDQERQQRIYADFDSYSEISFSGNGLHIIVKGFVPKGRRRSHIEIYSDNRYFAITGNVFEGKTEIFERQELLTQLWEQMGGPVVEHIYGEELEEKETDNVILERASGALNGEKFKQLHSGQWQSLYTSQSEADFAYIDILAFYTQNKDQIRRLFAKSILGQQPKDNYARRSDRKQYVEYMVSKSFDRQLPKIDIEGLKIRFESEVVNATPPYVKPVEPATFVNNNPYGFPPGLVGWIAQYIFDNSPTPVADIALVGALGFVSGLVGRAYNVSGTGLNQYILLIAQTGAGKEAIANGISNITEAIKGIVPTSIDYRGPGQIVSAPGLHKAFEKNPCFFSIIGEFGLELKKWTNPNNPMGTGIKQLLLQLFNRSGKGNVLDGSAYSDRSKNISPIIAPSLTIIGETAPIRFYEALDENMILDGLLPRFLIFEYDGPNPYFVKKEKQPVPLYIIESVANLIGICSARQSQNNVENVLMEPEAETLLIQYGRFATDQTNNKEVKETTRYLWSRAHMKALKFAAVIAVGINPINPVISYSIAMRVTDIISQQIEKLISKFDNDEVGEVLSSETKQMKLILKAIYSYNNDKFDKWKGYGAREDMWKDNVMSVSVLQRRLCNDKCFKHDRFGATAAITKLLKMLFENDDIAELSKQQMFEKFGTKGKAFVVINPKRFIPDEKK